MKSSQKSLVAEKWIINASPVIALAMSGSCGIVSAPAIPDTILAWDVGKGESAVLEYALWGKSGK